MLGFLREELPEILASTAMHKFAESLELLMKAGWGKRRGMGGPIVGTMREEGKEVAELLRVFGKEFQLTEPLLAEEGDGRHVVAATPSATTMQATETTTDLYKKGPGSGEGDQFWRPSMWASSAGFGATNRPRTGK